MNKFGRRKIALALACASVVGGKIQAMNIDKPQSRQTLGAVGGAAVKNQPKKINWNKIVKIGGFTVAGLAALEAIHSLIGGLTDSKLGSYSIGRAIRNRVKKNEQPDPAKPGDGNVENIKDNDNINDNINDDFNRRFKMACDLNKEHDIFMEEINNILEKELRTNIENIRLVDFNLAISGKLDTKYFDELLKALEKIKEENSGLTENQKNDLKDLLQVIKNNQINEKDAETIVTDSSSNNVKISVTLNSIVYCLELLGPGVNICKNGKLVAYLQYSK